MHEWIADKSNCFLSTKIFLQLPFHCIQEYYKRLLKNPFLMITVLILLILIELLLWYDIRMVTLSITSDCHLLLMEFKCDSWKCVKLVLFKTENLSARRCIFFKLLQFEKLWQFYMALLICLACFVLLQIFFFYRCMFFTLQKKGGRETFYETKREETF